MRLLAALFGAAILAQAQVTILSGQPQQAGPPGAQAPPQQWQAKDLGSISGTVVNELTGEPVRKATVTLDARSSGGSQAAWYTTLTNAEGKFEAGDLEPARYNVTVSAAGFLRNPKPTITTLAPAQKVTGVEIKVTPCGVVTGRVVNAAGEPMAGYVVALYQTRYEGGKRTLRSVTNGETNDLGEYRLESVPPGSYTVIAARQPFRGLEVELDRSAKPRQEDYVSTAYPGTTDYRRAVPIQVSAGRTMPGIDIKLAKMHVTSVRGRVINQTGADNFSVSLRYEDSADLWSFQARPTPQGDFEFRGIPPGAYRLEATTMSKAGMGYYWARQTIQVGQEPVENLSLTLTKGYELPGTIREDGGTNLDLRSLQVILRMPWRTIAGYTVSPARVDERGMFQLNEAGPERYVFDITRLPDGYYIKSARIGQVDAMEQGVNLIGGPAGPLEVVVRAKAPTVSGIVKDERDAPAAGATVALVPKESGRQGQEPFYRSVKTGPGGDFSLKNLPTGEYRLYAWAEVEDGAWVDVDFLKAFESKGKNVTLAESAAENVELRVIR